jgi:hypothetical protein
MKANIDGHIFEGSYDEFKLWLKSIEELLSKGKKHEKHTGS